VVADAWNPSTPEEEAGGWQVWGQPGLPCKSLSQVIKHPLPPKNSLSNQQKSIDYIDSVFSKDESLECHLFEVETKTVNIESIVKSTNIEEYSKCLSS
jgi:hypothetical protein